jgi:hypothetical protein
MRAKGRAAAAPRRARRLINKDMGTLLDRGRSSAVTAIEDRGVDGR